MESKNKISYAWIGFIVIVLNTIIGIVAGFKYNSLIVGFEIIAFNIILFILNICAKLLGL